ARLTQRNVQRAQQLHVDVTICNETVANLPFPHGSSRRGSEDAVRLAAVETELVELFLQRRDLLARQRRIVRRRNTQTVPSRDPIREDTNREREMLGTVPAHQDVEVLVDKERRSAPARGHEQGSLFRQRGDRPSVGRRHAEPVPLLERTRSVAPRERVVEALRQQRSEEHTSELQSRENLVCRLLL